MGDPFNIFIPTEFIIKDGTPNEITLSTATSSDQTGLNGSIANKIIYTIAKDFTTFTGIKTIAQGCIWTQIDFENGDKIIDLDIPSDYSFNEGTDHCSYTGSQKNDCGDECGSISNPNDVLQVAVLDLLRELDLDHDGLIDPLFDSESLGIDFSSITGIPFAYETNVQARTWTC